MGSQFELFPDYVTWQMLKQDHGGIDGLSLRPLKAFSEPRAERHVRDGAAAAGKSVISVVDLSKAASIGLLKRKEVKNEKEKS